MTQTEFAETKKWLESVIGITFSDEEAMLDGDGTAIFEKYIDADKWVTLFFYDDHCLVYLNLLNKDYNGLEICRSERRNAILCTSVFQHMICWN